MLKLYTEANNEAAALLIPMPRQLGPLGLFKGMQAAVESLTKADADIAKVMMACQFHHQDQDLASQTCLVTFKYCLFLAHCMLSCK